MTCNAVNFIKLLQKQNEEALEYIIDEYSPLVNAISYKILHNVSSDAVDECVNDVFLTVWQNANTFKGTSMEFKKWIAMLTKYKAIDRFRHIKKIQNREQSKEELQIQPHIDDVQMQIIKKEETNTLLLVLSTLPEIDRDIFMMKYFLYLTSAEIAASLKISVSAVENRLYRGKKKLAQNEHLKERFL
ncbi:sigma-70 family RNA polymerase sigma factor [Metabacillus halosaccharovorans]|uniref:sigma-70 family RNA polymerase sigma factor n=1 Tax=Metabacillus halosaccharovorans TaxID=930124 RepID=UPI0020401258|nr:sigma-70 family RNA polymerase sigma factor [Metabacillus halosaccharovorans]MCM3443927.1 sigma-70 family RNA polymerase sigma factor [Metabacillus halosaccharovorans]